MAEKITISIYIEDVSDEALAEAITEIDATGQAGEIAVEAGLMALERHLATQISEGFAHELGLLREDVEPILVSQSARLTLLHEVMHLPTLYPGGAQIDH